MLCLKRIEGQKPPFEPGEKAAAAAASLEALETSLHSFTQQLGQTVAAQVSTNQAWAGLAADTRSARAELREIGMMLKARSGQPGGTVGAGTTGCTGTADGAVVGFVTGFSAWGSAEPFAPSNLVETSGSCLSDAYAIPGRKIIV